MNVFDIIVYLALAWAVFNGWRRGFLLQMMSLVAVIAALYFAAQYGSELERILAINVGVEGVVGFIIIFVGALIITAIGGYVLRAVFRFAGLGVADILLGILFSWFASVNKNYDWVSKQTVEESRWFKPISEVTDKLTPYFNELTENFLD